jgi:hypothetical protein
LTTTIERVHLAVKQRLCRAHLRRYPDQMASTNGISRRELLIGGVALATAGSYSAQTTPSIDDFFRDLTAVWVRHDPSLATGARYFTGDEQDRLARQLTPRTIEWRRDRIARARKALVELRKFDRARMTELQRVSTDLLDWQPDTIIQRRALSRLHLPPRTDEWGQCRTRGNSDCALPGFDRT